MVLPKKSIYTSKKKTFLLALCSIVLVIIGIFTIYLSQDESGFEAIKLYAAGLVCIIIFSPCFLYFVRRLFDRKPALVIDSEGIANYSDPLNIGKVLWQDVTDIKIKTVKVNQFSSQKFVTIYLSDPQKYSQRGSWLSRKLRNLLWDEEVNISTNSLQIKLDDLVELVSLYHTQYK